MNAVNQYSYYLKCCNSNVRYFFIGLTLSAGARGIFVVIFNLYLKELGFTETFVGQTVSLQALAGVLILVPAGILSDNWGRRKLMIVSNIVKALCLIFIALTARSSLLLILVFGFGLSQAIFMVTNAPFLAENTKPQERLHLFSLSWALMMLATMLGTLFGGWLVDGLIIVANFSNLLSMRIALIGGGLLALVALKPLLKIKKEKIEVHKSFVNFVKNLRVSNEMPTMLKFASASLLLGLGAGLFIPYFNLYFAREFGLSAGSIGMIMALGQIMMAISSLGAPTLAQRIGRVKAICVFQAASIIFLLMLGQTMLLIVAIISFLLRGAMMNGANPMTTNLMMDNISDEMKGTANSMHQLVFQLGWAICGPISGFLITAYNYQFVFRVAAVFYLFSTLFFWFMFRGLEVEKTDTESTA